VNINIFYILASFDGRISRLQWWLGNLVTLIVAAPYLYVVFYMEIRIPGYIDWTCTAVNFYVQVALCVKRFHDVDRSYYWVIFVFLPPFVDDAIGLMGIPNRLEPLNVTLLAVRIGLVIVALWFFLELGFRRGTAGPNRFGDDPLAAPA
jgi:uncharacterized membrane protein YhaH (DUF805 family)